MSYLELLSSRAWEHFVWALLHTLWQGALIALLMSVALRRMPAHHSNRRYLIALAAQFAVLLAGLLTWSILDQGRRQTAPTPKDHALTSVFEPFTPVRSPAVATSPLPGIRQRHGPREHPPWTPIVAAVWLVGVGVMLTRVTTSVFAASRLANGTPVTDPTILALLEQTRLALGISRLVKVCAIGAECGPAVIGAIWPTLVLPVSMLTGLSSESLRLIIIHELAHVCRYDYLVNIVQMLIEAILFFNPAVWWIGRQVRLEREACCDAMVIRLTGRPLAYARSLAGFALNAHVLPVALAWGGTRRSSMLVDRLHRILRPKEKTPVRLSFWGLVLLLVAGPLLLLTLRVSTNAVVGMAARALTPAERLERVKAVEAEYRPPVSNPGGKATLKGSIRTPDGSVPPRSIWSESITKDRLGNVEMKSLGQFKGDFTVDVAVGTVWLLVDPNDYAPTVAGPFDTTPGKRIEGIRIVLDAGFSAHVRVMDEHGDPIAGAKVTRALVVNSGSSARADLAWSTDQDGIATIPHVTQNAYRLSAEASGFQAMESTVMTPAPTQTLTLQLTHARRARGIAVDSQGKPIASATVRISHRQADHFAWEFANSGPVVATTDAAGRFTLDKLVDDSVYTIIVTTKGGAQGQAQGIKPGNEGIRVTVGPGPINRTESPTGHSKRKVILRFVASDEGGSVVGAIDVYSNAPDGTASWYKHDFKLENGQAVLEVVAPGNVSTQPRSLLGYWFEEQHFQIAAGAEPQTIDVPVIPAGAIAGQVLEADGKPAAGGVEVNWRATKAPSGLKTEPVTGTNSPVDAKGRFFLSSLPIGGVYVVIASRGFNRQVSASVTLDGAHPTANVDLRLSQTVAGEGRVVAVDGKPLAGVPVMLELRHPVAGTMWSPPALTGRDGRFRFDDINAEFATDYWVSVESRKGFQPARSRLNPTGTPVEIRLQAGHVINGRVIDNSTGHPIPNVELYAHPLTWQPRDRHEYKPEGKTDKHGRFRFSNLPEGSMQLHGREVLLWKTPDKPLVFRSDQSEPIEVRLSLPPSSKLKPVPAGTQ